MIPSLVGGQAAYDPAEYADYRFQDVGDYGIQVPAGYVVLGVFLLLSGSGSPSAQTQHPPSTFPAPIANFVGGTSFVLVTHMRVLIARPLDEVVGGLQSSNADLQGRLHKAEAEAAARIKALEGAQAEVERKIGAPLAQVAEAVRAFREANTPEPF